MLQVLIIFKSCSVCYFENKIKIYKKEKTKWSNAMVSFNIFHIYVYD